MPKIDLEDKRKKLDREITLFHFKKAGKIAALGLKEAQKRGDGFFFFYFLAQRYILRQDFRTAIKYLNYCLRIRRNDGCTFNDKALSLAELGRYLEALACFDEGIRKDRDSATLYHNKGWLLHYLEKYRPALLYFKKALEIEPKRPESLYSLADTYEHLKNSAKAHKYFRQALENIKGKSSYMHRETLRRLKKYSF